MPAQRIVAFGYHDRASPRHWSVCGELRAKGAKIIECHTERPGFFPKCSDLARKYRNLRKDVDAVLLPFPGHYLMPLAWLLTRIPRKRLLFDVFLSLHDTEVHDRMRLSRWNPRAWLLWLIDYVSCHLADEVFVDTHAHRTFLLQKFGLPPDRVRVIYLRAREDLFFPCEKASLPSENESTNRRIHVLFYGTFIPLHGVEHILRAARILQDRAFPATFTLLGSGQTLPAMRALAEDLRLGYVRFLPGVSLKELPDLIRGADLCLGVFGTSDKAKRVIPHKIYDAVACGVPILTADTPAIREKFADHPLVHVCEAGNPEAIANAMVRLRSP